MNSHERVIAALNHRKPDRTPRLLYGELVGYVPAIERLLTEHCAPLSPRDYFQMDLTAIAPNPTHLPRERFREWLPDQAWETPGGSAAISKTQDLSAEISVDEWGVWWKPGTFHHFVQVHSPLAGIENLWQIEKFPWPDLDQPYRYDGVAETVARLHAEGVAVAAYAGAIFEQAWYLRGLQNTLEDMLLQPEIAHSLFERTAYYQKAAAVAFAKAGVDLIMLGDDVATQTGLMVSVSTWREFLKHHLAATIRAVHQAAPEAKVFYHSCGNITALIPELIAAGVQVLNPLQPECMAPAEIKQQYGRQLALFGSVSVQCTMPLGTPHSSNQPNRPPSWLQVAPSSSE